MVRNTTNSYIPLSVENEALVLKLNFNVIVVSIVFITCVKDQ